MSSEHCPCSDTALLAERVRQYALSAEVGAMACGFAAVADVAAVADERYRRWVESGSNATMTYLEKYADVRRNPALLLEGARTIVSCAFSYARREHHPNIADYALGRDYHDVVRQRLESLASYLRAAGGGITRVCVDTAPLRERYWAVECGVGYIGRNNYLIVPGRGASCVLGEVLWTGTLPADRPCALQCSGCGACVRACPTGALHSDGTIDARRCLSYLTIEHRGELPEGIRLGSHICGCDECRLACRECDDTEPTAIAEFEASPRLMALNREAMARLSEEDYREIFRGSSLRRCKLEGIRRNAQNATDDTPAAD